MIYFSVPPQRGGIIIEKYNYNRANLEEVSYVGAFTQNVILCYPFGILII